MGNKRRLKLLDQEAGVVGLVDAALPTSVALAPKREGLAVAATDNRLAHGCVSSAQIRPMVVSSSAWACCQGASWRLSRRPARVVSKREGSSLISRQR